MKKLQKVLAVSLAGCMALSMMATSVSAAPASTSSYTDVPATASYSAAIERLTDEGVMDGIGDGKFGPNSTVTRAQVITVLGRLAKANQTETNQFTDVKANSWYSGYVGWAVENGIVNGVGNGRFAPDSLVTSEHLNLMLTRYANTIHKDVTFYDTSASTVTRADLAQRLYQFYVEPKAPAEPSTEIRYVDRVVTVPGGTVTETVVVFVNADGYYVNAAGEYVNPETGSKLDEGSDPIQVPGWQPEQPAPGETEVVVVFVNEDGYYVNAAGEYVDPETGSKLADGSDPIRYPDWKPSTPAPGETVVVVVFVNEEGYYVNADGAYVNPETGAELAEGSDPIQFPGWQKKANLPITPVDEKMMPAVAHLTGEGKYGFGSGYLLGYKDNKVFAFLNIKYGNAERFKHPTPNTRYGSATSPSFCMNMGPVAPQAVTNAAAQKGFGNSAIMTPSDSDMYSQEENCLNLNVWTQTLEPNAAKPVLVFMHGGGYTEGASIEQKNYRGEYFTRYTDVVFVSVNARLNTLGYTSLDGIGGDPNCALADMVLALEWVQDNIAQFGGDPNNVTIMGQSGGGGKVSALASSPKAYQEKLFSKVVNASGSSASATAQASAQNTARGNLARVKQNDDFINWLRTEKAGEEVEIPAWTEVVTPARYGYEQVTLEDGKIPDKYLNTDEEGNKTLKDDSNLYVRFYGSYMAVDANDIGSDGTAGGAIVEYGLTNAIYERVVTTPGETVEHEAETVTVGNDCTFNQLRSYAQSDAVTAEDVFAYLQECPYDHLPSLSGATFVADNVYFSNEGSFGNNTPSQNYTYYYGSCWGEMSMSSSDGGVMQSNPDLFVGNIDMNAWEQQNYGTGRVGTLEEIKAEFEKVWPNHILYDLRANGTGSFGGQASLAGRLAEGQHVYTYFNAYDYPMFGGLTVVHTQDLGLMFHSLEALPYQIHGDEENAFKVADAAATALAEFCRTGVPKVNGEPLPANTSNASENYTAIFDVESRIVQSGFNSELNRLLQRQSSN